MNLTDQTYRLATRPASCLLLSYHYGPSSGPAIILAAVFGYGLPLVSCRRGGLVARTLPRRYFEA